MLTPMDAQSHEAQGLDRAGLDAKYLATFAEWLNGMGKEVLALGRVLEREELPESTRRVSAESLHYLLRTLALTPQGLEELAYLDALFAFRTLAQRTAGSQPEPSEQDASVTLARLAADAALVAAFLGDDFAAFAETVFIPNATALRGRSAEDAVAEPELRATLLGEVRAWAEDYQPPELASGRYELVKLRSFMRTKLRVHAH
jgi:hypothetical protein